MRWPHPAEERVMHTWVFRHRTRLRAIYGPDAEPVGIEAELEVYEAALPGEGGPEPEVPTWAGSIERGDSFVLLHPMPRLRTA